MYQNYSPPPNYWIEIRKFFSQGSVLSILITSNIAIWILIMAFRVVFFLLNQPDAHHAIHTVLNLLALPASISLISEKPWTIITYMFLHLDFWHLLFNMLWLFWFGKIFTEYLSGQRLLWVYLLGGIAGGAVYIAGFNLFPVFRPMIPLASALGASASVMAVVTTISFHVPKYTIQLLFFGRIKIIYLTIALFIFDFFMIPSENAGGHIAHIGGALFGMAYALFISGKNTERFHHFFRSRHSSPNNSGHTTRPFTDEEYNLRKKKNQERTDEILEKISKGGYDSLSREEKEFLFKSSTKN